MSLPPISVDILSDSDDASTPVIPKSHLSSNDRTGTTSHILLLDDDPTPQKPFSAKSTPSFVAETPLGFGSDVSVVPCSFERAVVSGLIFVKSDNESDGDDFKKIDLEPIEFSLNKEENLSNVDKDFNSSSSLSENANDGNACANHGHSDTYNGTFNMLHLGDKGCYNNILVEDFATEVSQDVDEEKNSTQEEKTLKGNGTTGDRKKQLKEEKARLIEERKRKRQEAKLEREAKKVEEKEMKKLHKEKQKWEKGKFALKSVSAEIDSKVIETGLIKGHLLTRFADKGFLYQITNNPIENSIIWKMNVPDAVAQQSTVGSEVPYIVVVFQADEFCHLVSNNLLIEHVNKVRSKYPSFTICYVTNKLMSYIKKCEQSQYKNPSNSKTWKHPPVDEIISELCTHYMQVHSRHCVDEPELAEHIIGLTSNLANCQFRKQLTWLSVNANGSMIPKDASEKNLIKKNIWLKALVAIPKVQPRHAIAIWKKYPTLRSLLNVYMDPNKSIHEKEFLLKDLTMEGILGNAERRLGEVCSKRVYRILMAQSGWMKTDDIENGADFFVGSNHTQAGQASSPPSI